MNTYFLKGATFILILMCFNVAAFGNPDGLTYKTDLIGTSDKALEKAIKTAAMTFKLQKRPPSTTGQLRRRMEKDLPRIQSVMESLGYYEGVATFQIDSTRNPLRTVFKIAQGAPFCFQQISVEFSGPLRSEPITIKPNLQAGQRVQAGLVFTEQQRILKQLKNNGFPFPQLEQRTVIVDKSTHTVDLTLIFNPGQPATFGPLELEGMQSLSPSYIQRQIPWNLGEKYAVTKLHSFETTLLNSGLFGSVQIEPRPPLADDQSVPIHISVTERDQRTIQLGVSYSDIGPGSTFFWEHRNAFGHGERLETTLSWTPIETGVEAQLTRPGFLDAHQSLVLDLETSYETPDAYTATQTRATGMVLRDFAPAIQGGAGLGYKFSQVDQLDESDRYAYVLFPVQLILDYRDDPLNSIKGGRLFSRATWYENTESAQSFIKTMLEGRHYAMLWETPRLSSALRVKIGHIDGAHAESIPADERFYAGGGGSIRGYDYQSVGPQEESTPSGTDSLIECSAELRLQPGPRMGYAAFLDAGTAFTRSFDEQDMRYGAGLGLRWFTPLGPLRADFAFPLNPDETQEQRLFFYISLGQSF